MVSPEEAELLLPEDAALASALELLPEPAEEEELPEAEEASEPEADADPAAEELPAEAAADLLEPELLPDDPPQPANSVSSIAAARAREKIFFMAKILSVYCVLLDTSRTSIPSGQTGVWRILYSVRPHFSTD